MFNINIEKSTLKNNHYRKVLYTDTEQQLVVMSLSPGEFIPQESHNGSQFFRIEEGNGVVFIKKKKVILKDGTGLIIPKNTKHTIKNTSKTKSLKIYSIYSPPQHPPKTLHKRQNDDKH